MVSSSRPRCFSGTMFGAVGRRVIGILVRLHEDRRDTHGNGGARQDRHELALAAGRGALPARLLHRMGGVEHHGISGIGEDRQRAHVADQRVVAEGNAALAGEHVVVAGGGTFRDDVLHVPGRQELPLLDVDRAAGLRCRDQEIGLAREEGRDLQHIDRLRGDGALLLGVDVGQHRHAVFVAELGEDRQAGFEPDAASGRGAGAVRLVEAGLVDEADAELAGQFGQRMAHLMGMRATFELARASD